MADEFKDQFGRDRRDLILGGYNGGKAKTSKGFAKWKPEELKAFTKKRERDSKGTKQFWFLL